MSENNLSIKENVKKYFDKSKNKEKYNKEGTLDLRIARGVAMEKKDKKEANRLLELIKERNERYKKTYDTWKNQGSTHSWNKTLNVIDNYDSFVQEAERRLKRKLTITTAGGPTSQHSTNIGALDIGKLSNNLSPEEYSMIGKLALEHGYRVGDEADHLHIDSRPRNQGTTRIFHNIPSQSSIDAIEDPEKQAQKQALRSARLARQETQEFQQFEEKRKSFYENFATNLSSLMEKVNKNKKEEKEKTENFLSRSPVRAQFEVDQDRGRRIQLQDLVNKQKKLQGEF